MEVLSIYRRSIKFVLFGVTVIGILKTIPMSRLSNNEILMIVAYVSVLNGIIDVFSEKIKDLV